MNTHESTVHPGHFALPMTEQVEPLEQMEQMEQAAQTDKTLQPHDDSGARLTQWDETDDAEARCYEDFPMIVWLRGDEPWFQQFDMDAESVMRTLGIKRSRLTQIAGKDLRVGRVRVDRYIRPVFRRTDVERYVAWTRATASHQKSSDAIKTAVDQLSQQSELIQKTLDDVGQRLTRDLKGELSQFISQAVSEGISPVERRVADIDDIIKTRISGFEDVLTKASSAIIAAAEASSQSIQELIRSQQAALETLTLQMHQTSEKTAVMEERLSIWDQSLSSHLDMITMELAKLGQPKPFIAKRSKRKAPTAKTQPSNSPVKTPLQKRHAPKRR
jgi:hypothetical protein